MRISEHDGLPYFDVNGDGHLTPLDALLLINLLNQASTSNGSGEGESPPVLGKHATGIGLLPREPFQATVWTRQDSTWTDGRPSAGTRDRSAEPSMARTTELPNASPPGILPESSEGTGFEQRLDLPDWESLLAELAAARANPTADLLR